MSPRFGVLPIFPAQEIKRNEGLIRFITYFSCTGNQENLEHDTVKLCAMVLETDWTSRVVANGILAP
jgi:hypothetical protein